MIQDILVIILIALASAYALWKGYRKFKPKVSDVCETSPSGCGGCGEDCTLRKVKNESNISKIK